MSEHKDPDWLQKAIDKARREKLADQNWNALAFLSGVFLVLPGFYGLVFENERRLSWCLMLLGLVIWGFAFSKIKNPHNL